ncbi:MAG: hypothetical protein HY303_10095 [Candidatus Wallbacteria bacterium]|nr:hypothetical protein [Candidatus Wallbacteria bacterium]
MLRDEDTQAFQLIAKGLLKKLQGESAAQAMDGPPAGGNPADHAAALKARLEASKKIADLIANLG